MGLFGKSHTHLVILYIQDKFFQLLKLWEIKSVMVFHHLSVSVVFILNTLQISIRINNSLQLSDTKKEAVELQMLKIMNFDWKFKIEVDCIVKFRTSSTTIVITSAYIGFKSFKFLAAIKNNLH